MNKTLQKESMDFVIVYLDDILIASNSMEEYLQYLDAVLTKLEQAGFKLNKDKYEFLEKGNKIPGAQV